MIGIPLALAVWGTVGTLTAIAWMLGRRPGLGTSVAPFMIGPTMQVVLAQLQRTEPPSAVLAKIGVHLAAIAAVGLGAGAVIVAGLGAGTGELLAKAASERSGRPELRVRVLFELSWIVLGVVLGGPIGVGTVLVAVLIGPSVARGHRLVDGAVTVSRRQLAGARLRVLAA